MIQLVEIWPYREEEEEEEQSWRYADAFQRSIILEAIYHFFSTYHGAKRLGGEMSMERTDEGAKRP